jgi:hypothetical protein
MKFDNLLEMMVGNKVRFENRFFVVDAILMRTAVDEKFGGGWVYHACTKTAQVPGFRANEINGMGITRLCDNSDEVVIRLP